MVSGLVCITGSGIAARATLLTLAAVTAAAITPAPPKKLRRDEDGLLMFWFIVFRIFNVQEHRHLKKGLLT
jgi:hypothetical protein